MVASIRAAAHDLPPAELKREVGLLGATMMGLGSIVGTGVFVSIGIAAGAAGPSVVLAICLAALVAACNGLSSAQLAANHPLSGGTYEYGYRWLTPSLGFTAGWMFLCAKSASAATAALGFSAYALQALGADQTAWRTPLAVAVVWTLTLLVLSGIRRSSNSNIAVVCVTLFCLIFFVVAGLPTALSAGRTNLLPFFAPVAAPTSPVVGFFEACALMFVAYTGYGRIATMAEEVQNPRRTIPLAIIVTLSVSMALYIAIGLVGILAVGSETLASAAMRGAAPLDAAARQFGVSGTAEIVAVGAVTAMLGVLLNLILGLSRVALAMARRRDIPSLFARVGGASGTPYAAVLVVSGLITGLALLGDVKTTWSFSGFTVLIYYAITNLAAIQLQDHERLYPRMIAWLGLVSCLFLAFWVDSFVWMVGLALLGGGLAWHVMARRLRERPSRA